MLIVLPTTTTEIKHKTGAVLEDGGKEKQMEENKVKSLIDALDLVNEQMVQKQEISTIAVAVKLEGLDQVNEELDKMLIKLEKANSLADELASKIKDLCSK